MVTSITKEQYELIYSDYQKYLTESDQVRKKLKEMESEFNAKLISFINQALEPIKGQPVVVLGKAGRYELEEVSSVIYNTNTSLATVDSIIKNAQIFLKFKDSAGLSYTALSQAVSIVGLNIRIYDYLRLQLSNAKK